ncbi:hypothetical protein [Fusobacterium sp.]|uniref:hypothetical protein n=1 Tax=Fusobacterium sp. TaxID=68766 RepID=UPI002A7EAE07|nr:hypothetical protein [Fusobacterium sp.]
MNKNINFISIKEIIEKDNKGYMVKDKVLFYDFNLIRIHSLYEVSKKTFGDIFFIENVYQIDDLEVPTKLTFTLKKQYGKDVDNLLLVFSDGKWHELWIKKIF